MTVAEHHFTNERFHRHSTSVRLQHDQLGESATMNVDSYTFPRPCDVLGGRGSKQFFHPGNRVLRQTISDRLSEYIGHGKDIREKRAIIREIISTFQEQGGKFLKFDNAVEKWYNAGPREFRKKISHAFRDASIPNKVKCLDAMRVPAEVRARSPTSSRRLNKMPHHLPEGMYIEHREERKLFYCSRLARAIST